MVEAANFADDMAGDKSTYNETDTWNQGQKWWHYTNIPFFFNGKASDYNLAQPKGKMSITQVIPELRQIMRKDDGYENLAVYKSIASNPMYKNETDEGVRSIALRLLIHYVGDIHQPLHTYQGFSSQYKHGDQGGNFEKITYKNHAESLHAAWDSIFGIYHERPYANRLQPLNEETWASLEGDAKVLESKHNISNFNQTQL